ncbi:small heat shock protein p26-like protein [Leptotrombidium deliense]|uniref:Small heat shock protein p26-like protein n=1 Tax=Leptotrombidium deliense TaxID=299467 RepID=A0A443SJU8_9ACAR|nr:small heat shock protein p26-like protein [Leptotrombidium deliense]
MAAKPMIIEPQYMLVEPSQVKYSKSSIDYLVRTNSPRVQLVPKKGKSDVWQRFSTIQVDGNEVEFCCCHQCGGIVTHTKNAGTNGMRSHRCKERRDNVTAVPITATNRVDYSNRNSLILMPSSGIRIGNETRGPLNSKKKAKEVALSPYICNTQLVYNTPTNVPFMSTNPKKRKHSKVRNDDSVFEVDIDCAFFKQSDLTVKTVGDDLVIHAEHDERKDDIGYIKRQFTRRISIPADVELDKLSSTFRASGVLTVKAPKRCSNDPSERIIPITWSNNDVEDSEEEDASEGENVQNDESSVIDDNTAENANNEDYMATKSLECTNEELV